MTGFAIASNNIACIDEWISNIATNCAPISHFIYRVHFNHLQLFATIKNIIKQMGKAKRK